MTIRFFQKVGCLFLKTKNCLFCIRKSYLSYKTKNYEAQFVFALYFSIAVVFAQAQKRLIKMKLLMVT